MNPNKSERHLGYAILFAFTTAYFLAYWPFN